MVVPRDAPVLLVEPFSIDLSSTDLSSSTSSEAAGAAYRYTSGWGNQGPAIWLGDRTTLAAFEAERGGVATQRDLESALHARSTNTSTQVRMPKRVRPGQGDGRATSTATLAHVEVTFVATPELAQEWRDSDPERRSALKQRMLLGGEAALKSLTASNLIAVRPLESGMLQREPATGFAAAAVVKATPGAHGSSPRLEVRTVLFGIQRADGAITGAEIPQNERRDWELKADFVAWETVARSSVGLAPRPERRATSIGPEDLWVPDPLDELRAVLGDARFELLSAQADEQHQVPVEGRSRKWLIRRLRRLGRPRELLDIHSANETLELERALAAADERLEQAVRDQSFYALMRVEEPDEWRRLAAAEQGAWRTAGEQRLLARRHGARLMELDLAGLHPFRWVEEHGQAAVLEARIERELGIRTAVEIANTVEAAIANHDARLVDALGAAPDRDRRARIRREGLARDLVWTHHAAKVHPREVVRAIRGDLDRRIDAWSADQGLAQGYRGFGRETGPGPGRDIGI